MTVYIPEVGLQSFHDYNHRLHHFEYTASLVGVDGEPGTRMLLTPVNDIYTFTQPLKSIDGLTLQFSSPDAPLALPVDAVDGVTFATDGAGAVVVTAPAALSNGSPVDLSALLLPGDRVFFDGVTLGGATPDFLAIQAYLSKSDGLFVGAAVTARTLTLDPALTLPTVGLNTAVPTSTSVRMRIAKNRLRAPFRVRKIVERVSNYLIATAN